MKKNIILVAIVLLACSNMLFAQDAEYKKQQTIYKQALIYNDFIVARTALYNMMALQPSNTGLLDTLSYLYYEQQQYISSAITAQEAAKKNPNNVLALEIAGNSFENIGLNDKALEHYELLYLKNSDISILYKIAFLQYRLKRYNDALASAEIIINNPKAQELKMVFGKKDKTRQEVPMIAASYRLKALVAYDRNDTATSLQNFQKALEYAPDFEIVVEAVNQLKK
ncbi:MAG: hypothetical protein AAFQ94_16110 [Bacteroidota bacterium]